MFNLVCGLFVIGLVAVPLAIAGFEKVLFNY